MDAAFFSRVFPTLHHGSKDDVVGQIEPGVPGTNGVAEMDRGSWMQQEFVHGHHASNVGIEFLGHKVEEFGLLHGNAKIGGAEGLSSHEELLVQLTASVGSREHDRSPVDGLQGKTEWNYRELKWTAQEESGQRRKWPGLGHGRPLIVSVGAGGPLLITEHLRLKLSYGFAVLFLDEGTQHRIEQVSNGNVSMRGDDVDHVNQVSADADNLGWLF